MDNEQIIQEEDAIKQAEAAKYDEELELCKKAGGDIDKIKNKKLDYNQLVEVRKGLESGVDVSRYMNSSTSWMLMEELRLEMEQNIDMTPYRKDGYELSQISEIRQGLAKGIDVSEYKSKEYLGDQMKQIRLGIEADLPIVFYKDSSFDAGQMNEIRLGLIDNVDISVYAKTSIPAMKMKEARECMKAGLSLSTDEIVKYSAGVLRQLKEAYVRRVDISDYVKEGYDEDQLEQIIKAREEHIDEFDKYLSIEMRGENLREILIGLEEGLEISYYANHEFNYHQMREIRRGLEKRLDVSIYAKPLYQPRQMHEIRKGLESGIDVSKYSSMIYSARDMKEIRMRLEKGLDAGVSGSRSLVLDSDLESRGGHISGDYHEGSDIYKKFDGSLSEKRHYLQLSPDGLKAYLTLPRIKNVGNYTLDFVLELLGKADVTFGIKKDVILDVINNERFEERVLVAEGYGPTFGKDGYYEYFFESKISNDIIFEEDGSANFDNIKYFASVNVGDKLAVYHPAIKGSDGKTVKNITLPGKNGRDLPMIRGRGFMVMDDRRTYCATISGAVRFIDYELTISQLMEVEESRKPLSIDYVGTVWVKGEVADKSVIRAKGDVIIDGYVEGSNIEAEGDIIFKSGCNGLDKKGKVTAGGNIYARHLQNLRIYAAKSVFCNEMIYCKAEVKGNVMVYGENGAIIGGDVATQTGINAAQIGNDTAADTIVRVGVTSELLNDYNEVKKEMDKVTSELEPLRKEQKRMVTAQMSTREQLQWKIKINMAVSTKEKELSHLESRMKEINDEMQKAKGASITARDTIYAGVSLVIDGKQLDINTTRQEKGGIIYQK